MQALAQDAFPKPQTVTLCRCFLLRKKQHAHGKRLLRRQGNRSPFEEKRARNCGQNTDAVAALVIGGYRAAVRQTSQRSQCEPQNVVIRRAVQRRNESNAARLMVKAGAKKGPAGGAN